MAVIKNITAGKAEVRVYDSRRSMAASAAKDIADKIVKLLNEKEEINMIFAAAPSQSDTLAELILFKDIDWTRINAFHMDEYIGLPEGAPQAFGNFLKKDIFDKVPFKSVNLIDSCATDIEAECERYGKLIDVNVDIVCLGIGENGHIAFNDPGVADFNDTKIIKEVELDEKCRNQQVNDGCFAKIDDVPKFALTLTVPTLFKGNHLFCMVPAKTKAEAVKNTVMMDVSEECPATIMKNHSSVIIYCDNESGKLI